MTDKTATEIMLRSQQAKTRCRVAAGQAGYITEREVRAFVDGAYWMWEQMKMLEAIGPPPLQRTTP